MRSIRNKEESNSDWNGGRKREGSIPPDGKVRRNGGGHFGRGVFEEKEPPSRMI